METSEPRSVTGFPLKKNKFSGILQKEIADGRDGGGGHYLPSLTRRHESPSGEEAADCLGSEPEAKRCNYRRSVGVQQIQRLPTTTTTTSSVAAGLECDTAACLREAE